ncbi:unnamed protein product [Amoebophrya sp. A120]|nr:unnamed protein product [Amoebophrya sp. A120]|eukprot:GSA120T00003337001.1
MYDEEVRFALRLFVDGLAPERKKNGISLKVLTLFLKSIGVHGASKAPAALGKSSERQLFYALGGRQGPFTEDEVCELVAKLSNSELERVRVEKALRQLRSKEDFLRAAGSFGLVDCLRLSSAELKFLDFLVADEEGAPNVFAYDFKSSFGKKKEKAVDFEPMKKYLGYAG